MKKMNSWVNDHGKRIGQYRFFEVDENGRYTGKHKTLLLPTDRNFPIMEVIATGPVPDLVETNRRDDLIDFEHPAIHAKILVSKKCPECGKELQQGSVNYADGFQNPQFFEWKCVDHGEVVPEWYWL